MLSKYLKTLSDWAITDVEPYRSHNSQAKQGVFQQGQRVMNQWVMGRKLKRHVSEGHRSKGQQIWTGYVFRFAD